ncbi:MAG: hypothetical protein BWK73_31420 [Thiothrix lacustris]|uniref:Uncharacterized protein n=1 Tax=Thiothrix lacustris TaxID=525917 RepID=A0A1Y1QI46_9GAMM|nr:MAG: hypothetical protein BWK73_31420 [Thiothrix lacustris]
MKNIQKNLVFSAVGYMLPMLAALATIPVMVDRLGVDLYGLYTICISLIGFMALVDFGVGQTVIKYVAEYEATGQTQRVQPLLGVAMLIYLVVGVVSAIALYGLAPLLAQGLYEGEVKQELAQDVLRITSVPLLLGYVNQFFLNVCKAYHRFDVPAVIHNAGNLSGIVLATLLLLAGYALREVLWGYVLIQTLALVAGYVASLRVVPAGIHLRPRFERQVLRSVLSFSVYTFIGNFIGALTSRVDKLLIGLFVGTEAVTYYQIPFTIAQMANGLVHTLSQIVFPRFSEMSGLQDRRGLLRLYGTVNAAVLLMSLVIAVMLISVDGVFLSVWISPEFANKATDVLMVIALYFLLQSSTVAGYWVLQGAGKAQQTALMFVVDASAYFIALYYLANHYGYLGAAYALFFLLLATPLQYVWVARHIGYSVTRHVAALCLSLLVGAGLLKILATLNVQIDHSWGIIVMDGVLMAVVFTAALWVLLKRAKQGWRNTADSGEF